MNDPVLPRKRKVPRRYSTAGASYFPESSKELNHNEYFSVLDFLNYIKDRFYQPGYDIYKQLQEILLKAAAEEDDTGELQLCSLL